MEVIEDPDKLLMLIVNYPDTDAVQSIIPLE
jgi:hypothetical protein